MILAKDSLRVAIIGAREASPDGQDFAFAVGKLLAEQGVLVYTGGGAGIMEAAFQGESRLETVSLSPFSKEMIFQKLTNI